MTSTTSAPHPFDVLLAQGTTDPRLLGPAAAEALRTLSAPQPWPPPWGYAYVDRLADDDAGRLAVLAAAAGDRKLWHRVVDYLVERDSAHRTGQRYGGIPKDELGPIPTGSRGAGWAVDRAERRLQLMPAAAAAPLLAQLREWQADTR